MFRFPFTAALYVMLCSRFSSETKKYIFRKSLEIPQWLLHLLSVLCLFAFILLSPVKIKPRSKASMSQTSSPDLPLFLTQSPTLAALSVQSLFLFFLQKCLFLHQFSEQSLFVAQQLCVRAALCYTMLVENSHGVGVLDGGQAVSDDHDCPPCWLGGAQDIERDCVILYQLSKTLKIINK